MSKKEKLDPRKSGKQPRANQTFADLLEASARLFAKEGLLRATTNRIAEVAGVSIGTLYQYFPNKESIVAILAERRIKAELAHIEQQLKDLAQEPLETAIAAFIQSIVKLYIPNTRLDVVLIESLGKVNRHRRLLEAEQQAARMIQGYLEMHSRNSDYLPNDLELACFIMVQSVHSSIHSAAVLRPELLQQPEFSSELTRLCLRYLLGQT